MFKQKTKTIIKPSPDFPAEVKLKSHLGLRPGQYLTIIFSAIFLLLIFLIFFMPGLTRYGTVFTFHSQPNQAAIWVDNQYKGFTPLEVFVPAGNHTIEIRKAFYKSHKFVKKINGRLFATLFSPQKETIYIDLPVEDYQGLLNWNIQDFANWGMQEEYYAAYQLPPILVDTAQVVRQIKNDQIKLKQLYNFVANAAFFVDSQAELYELLNALLVVESRGILLTPAQLSGLVKKVQAFIQNYPTFPYWLLSILPNQNQLPKGANVKDYLTQEKILTQDWFKRFHELYVNYIKNLKVNKKYILSSGAVDVADISFYPVPAGLFVAGRDNADLAILDEYFPAAMNVYPFYMMETEVTNAQFKRFLQENPQWAKSNSEALIRDNKVTDKYLSDWSNNLPPKDGERKPVTYVSYFAAQAFTEWLTEKLPARLKNYEVRLPYSTEWEWAIKFGGPFVFEDTALWNKTGPEPVDSDFANKLGLKNLVGNVWEWSEDWYLPVKNLLSSLKPARNMVEYNLSRSLGAEKIVRGGSWATRKEEMTSYLKGAQPPAWCTPYLGFRVVLAPKR